jgi:3-oxoacyl-[acyl-carrier-protein] synthase-1
MNLPVVAIGARTPVGLRAATSAAAVRCEIRRVFEHPFMVDGRGEPLRAGLDARLDATRLGGIRLLTLARSALQEALRSLFAETAERPPVDVLLCLPETRPGFTEANGTWIATELLHGLLPGAPTLAAPGHAGVIDALRAAAGALDSGRAEIVAIVGVESYLHPDTIDWLDADRRIAGEGNRDGFYPGEAAGCIVLANRSAQAALRRPTLATVRGVHSAHESISIRGEEEVLGHGLTAAVLGATASLQLPMEAVDDVYCDLNGERYRTDEWGFTLLRAGRAMRTVGYHMPAACWGDVGAASGALGCVLAIRAWARGYAHGPRALVWGGSEHGLRAAAVLEHA